MSSLAQPRETPIDPSLFEAFSVAFDREIHRQVAESGIPLTDWFKSGLSTPESSVEQWHNWGPRAVQNFIDWYEDNQSYHVWTSPDGQPGVELKVDVLFPVADVRVIGFIDAVLVHSQTGELFILDTKSGGTLPESDQQLGFYATLLELKYGIRPPRGAYFMARGAGRNKRVFLCDPVDLSVPELSREFFDEQLHAMQRQIDSGAFTSRLGKHCRTCGVQNACAAFGGARAIDYDPDHPEFVPF